MRSGHRNADNLLVLAPVVAAPDSPLRSEALRWVVERLATLQLRRGALAEAAGLYQQLLSLDTSALSGPPDAACSCPSMH